MHWVLPPSGKLKLNVDAAVSRCNSAAGAIVRNDRGDIVLALCFYLPLHTPLRAELMALQYALIYYSQTYDSMIIETDCRLLLDHLSDPN